MAAKKIKSTGLQKYVTSTYKNLQNAKASTLQSSHGDEVANSFFVAQVGNYYVQTKNPLLITTDAAKIEQTSGDIFDENNEKTQKELVAVNVNEVHDEDDDMDYLLILDDVISKGVDTKSLEQGDKKVYDFDNNDDMDDDSNNVSGEEVSIADDIIHLKSESLETSGVTHRCMHCDYTTTKRYLLSRHLRAHSTDRPHKCAVCERGFKSNASLLNHVNTHLGNKPHSCKNCDRAFTTSGELVRHVRYKHTLEKPHKCSECDYASVELSKLKRHMRCHTGERPYQCPHCTYASPDTFKLKRHLRTHTGEKPYECDICHSRFTQSNSMKAHRMIHSVGEKPVFQCSLCPTTCGRKTDLRIHIQKLHHSDEPINCKRCGKDFPDRYTYKVHVKTHEGEKCYKCSFCPYASISLRHLESHTLIHTDQKPFLCELCNLSFRQKQLLKRHNNLYHNKYYIPPKPREKRHTCPDCKRTFSHKGNLMRHMEMHDPHSKFQEEKLKLKVGRNTRVRTNGTIEILRGIVELNIKRYYSDDTSGFDETAEVYEVLEATDDDDDDGDADADADADDDDNDNDNENDNENENENDNDQKPPVMDAVDRSTSPAEANSTESLTDRKEIKEEPDDSKCVTVEGSDGYQYLVVEVSQCTDDEDDQRNDSTEVVISKKKADIEHCFGFIDVPDGDYSSDSQEKETIQLLEIIDED